MFTFIAFIVTFASTVLGAPLTNLVRLTEEGDQLQNTTRQEEQLVPGTQLTSAQFMAVVGSSIAIIVVICVLIWCVIQQRFLR